jgi:predicted Zn-dependent peptidase
VDRPDAVQTVVQFIMPSQTYTYPKRPQFDLLNTILGGSFTSRLNQNLREEHGYTYGARSRFRMNPSAGFFTAYSSVRTDVTGESIKEFLKEFAEIRFRGVTPDEVEKSRATRRMQVVQSFQGLGGILGTAATLVRNHRPFSAIGDELNDITRVTAGDLKGLALSAIPLERSLLVLVGDRDEIMKQLEGIDLPAPIELTAAGDPADHP